MRAHAHTLPTAVFLGFAGIFVSVASARILHYALSMQTAALATSPLRVLVAEDVVMNQKVTAYTLRSLGYECTIAGNGLEAVSAWATGGYAAILMDCEMPKMNGFDATAEIRRREAGRARTPIIALTASDSDADHRRCLAAGMDACAPKSVKGPELAAILKQAGAEGGVAESSRTEPKRMEWVDALDVAAVAALRELAEPGEPDPFPQIAAAFLGHATSRLATLSADTGREVLSAVAHSLRGMSGTIGARRLAGLCAELETRASEPGGAISAPRLVHSIRQEFDRVRRALEHELAPGLPN